MITDINLQNFRSYANDSFELSPSVNIIVGPNASGKTNLLEAILMVSIGSSYRARDLEVMQFNKPWARVEAHTKDFSRVIKIEKFEDNRTIKTFIINTKIVRRLNISQTLPVVLFEPNHLLTLNGPPELRRSYIDNILEQTVTGFKALKARYKRALAQRNTQLKQGSSVTRLFVWNVRISELGGQIFRERIELIKKLQALVPDIYKSLSEHTDSIEFTYESDCKLTDYETDLLKKLEQHTELDVLRGFTSHGPHRDDLKISINSKLAGAVISRGEARTVLLAMKVVEAKLIEEIRNQKPLLLFDDVFSELDRARRLALTKLLNNYQTFITTTDADVVVRYFTESALIIPTKS